MVTDKILNNLHKFCEKRDKQKIKENWEKPLKKSTIGFDEYILYPVNPDGTKTGGKTYGLVDIYDEQSQW